MSYACQPGAPADIDLACDVAISASHLLNKERFTVQSGKARGKHGDMTANELIIDLLTAARPHDAILSEETEDDARRLSADRVWIVDPLDGTREYSSDDRNDWAVHIALWERTSADSGVLSAAAVTLPALGLCYHTATDAQPLTFTAPASGEDLMPASEHARLVMSGSRAPAWITQVAQAARLAPTPLGSAGAKTMAVVRGDAHAYVHAGGQYQWDSAAPIAVAWAHGLDASRISGAPLLYNETATYLPDLIVSTSEHYASLRKAIDKSGGK